MRVTPKLTRRGFLGGLAAGRALAAAPRPNIILAMGDDHGWIETGYNGHPHVRTPALDEMARVGMRFERFYTAAPVCSPTRGSVMTGRHPNRYGTFAPNFSIRPEEITLAHILRQAGYACGHFGKWHLGPVKAGSPTNPGAMGFDEWLSHDNFFELDPPLVRNGGPVERIPGESSEIVAREAMRFLRDTKRTGKPAFVVLWFGSPHGPYSGLEKDLALYKNAPEPLRARFAEITALDRAMGQLRSFLASEGMKRDTMLWYCGDNGVPPDARLTTPFRGNKGQIYDGGLRVPGLLEWPAMMPKPRAVNTNVVTSDMLPTICDVLGLPLPGRPLDGISLRPLLGGAMPERPSPICFWQYDRQADAKADAGPYLPDEQQLGTTPTTRVDRVVFRNYRHPRPRTENFGGTAAILGNRYKLMSPRQGPLELYDVSSDPGEKNDIAASHPGMVRDMERQLREWQRSVENSLAGRDYR